MKEEEKNKDIKNNANKENVKPEAKKEKVEQKTEAKPKKDNAKGTIKKKSNDGIIIAMIVIAVIILAVIAYMCLMANTPKKAVEGMLNSLKTSNFEKVNEYVNYTDLLKSSNVLNGEDLNQDAQKLLFDRLDWKIINVTQDNNNATAELEITNKDFKVVIGNYMQKALKSAFSGQEVGEAEFENYLIEELQKEDVQTTTQTKTITLTKQQDGKWKVNANEDLVITLLPGLNEVINSLS